MNRRTFELCVATLTLLAGIGSLIARFMSLRSARQAITTTKSPEVPATAANVPSHDWVMNRIHEAVDAAMSELSVVPDELIAAAEAAGIYAAVAVQLAARRDRQLNWARFFLFGGVALGLVPTFVVAFTGRIAPEHLSDGALQLTLTVLAGIAMIFTGLYFYGRSSGRSRAYCFTFLTLTAILLFVAGGLSTPGAITLLTNLFN